MKREDKKILSRQKILDSALQEFGTQGYGLSSINTICQNGNVSKGNMYHYFKDKDDLFLTCVKECFDDLKDYLKANFNVEDIGIQDNLKQYFDLRMGFFEKKPLYQKIFCNAIIYPPDHLSEKIRNIKEEFDQYNIFILTSLLETAELSTSVSIREVVEVFRMYQDFVNAKFQTHSADYDSLKKHEEVCNRTISILLYGVIKRKE